MRWFKPWNWKFSNVLTRVLWQSEWKGMMEEEKSDKIISKRGEEVENGGKGLKTHQHSEAKALVFILIHFQ